jgi:small ligand-binding sensory domain FIST
MRWASEVSVEPSLDAAIGAACNAVCDRLGTAAADIVVVFVSERHRGHFDRVPDLVAKRFASGLLLGCSAGGVIGGGKEVEHQAAVSVTAALLPGVELTPLRLEPNTQAGESGVGVAETVTRVGAGDPHFVLLPDPFSFDAERFLRELDHAYPGSRKLGGLASGGRQLGANALFLGSEVFHGGLVGVALSGNLEVDTIVAQGCRPVGQPMFVTRCREHVLLELDGQPAGRALEALYENLSPADKRLAEHSLFLGIVMSEDRQEYRQGDFLIRNIIGMDPGRGALAVGATLRENVVVQFHLRDARTSADDLEQMLSRYRIDHWQMQPAGALLFSCLGRGEHLYGYPDHDSKAFRRMLGDVSLGGFFCNGEIGPVHGTTFLHGYTSAFGLFRSKPGA